MITKILITIALVIAAVAIFLRRRAAQQPQVVIVNDEPDHAGWMFKWFAYGLAGAVTLSAIGFYYLDWRDGYRLYDITITNPQTGKTDNYRAYKKDLHGHRFTSVTGHDILVSELERIEYAEVP